jgi:peptidoglycan/LPS O-acetylase OafA/YrhL
MMLLGIVIAAMLASLLYRNEAFRETFRYSIQGLALMPIFYLVVSRHEHPLFRWLNFAPVRKLGVYSYSIYLIQLVLIVFIEGLDLHMGNNFILLIEASAASILYAFVIYRYIDKPFARMRHQLRD